METTKKKYEYVYTCTYEYYYRFMNILFMKFINMLNKSWNYSNVNLEDYLDEV